MKYTKEEINKAIEVVERRLRTQRELILENIADIQMVSICERNIAQYEANLVQLRIMLEAIDGTL